MEGRRRAGFTLIEVLVALLVLGAVGAAAIALVGQNARFIAASEDRLYASIAADNAMVDAVGGEGVLDRGEVAAEVDFAGRKWTVTRTVSDSGVEGLMRVDIAVRKEKGTQTLARATTLRREGVLEP